MKRKRTAAEKRERRERKKKFMTIFVHGKQKRVPRPELIDGIPVDEFIRQNADPIWLHMNEMWHLMPPSDNVAKESGGKQPKPPATLDFDDSELPF